MRSGHTGSPTWPGESGRPQQAPPEQPHGTGPAGPGSSALEPSAVILSQTGPPDTLSSSGRAEMARAAPPSGRRGGHQHPLSSSLPAGQSGAALLGWSPGSQQPQPRGAVVYRTREQSWPWAGRQSSAQRRAASVKPAPHPGQRPRPRTFHPQQTKAHVLADAHTQGLTAALATAAENWTHQEVLQLANGDAHCGPPREWNIIQG